MHDLTSDELFALSDVVRARLDWLDDLADQLSAAHMAADRKFRNVVQPAWRDAQGYATSLERQPDKAALAEAIRRANQAKIEMDDWRQRAAERQQSYWLVSGPLGRCTDYIRTALSKNVELVAAPELSSSLPEGETFETAVARIRSALGAGEAQVHSIRSAPLPSTAIKAEARRQIDLLADRGHPDLENLIDHLGEIGWEGAWPASASVMPSFDPLRLILWANRDRIVAAIEKEIDASSDDARALDEDERARRRAAVASSMYALELEEAALLFEAAGAILPRKEADERALLGLAPEMPVLADLRTTSKRPRPIASMIGHVAGSMISGKAP